MAEGESRPGAESEGRKEVAESLKRAVRMELVVLDPVNEDFPSEEAVFETVKRGREYGNELFRNWSSEADLEMALKAEIHRRREELLASQRRARDVFKGPDRRIPAPPNPYA